MKQFELTLHRRSPDGKFLSLDKIEADDLVQLMCQFNLIMVNTQRTLNREELDKARVINDDIPF